MFSALLELLCDEHFVILSAIILSIKSPVASAVFRIALFEEVFIVSVVDFFPLSRSTCSILFMYYINPSS